MLKSVVILAVFFAVTQAPVPVVGQTTNNSTHVSRDSKQAAKPNQGKTPPVAPSPQTQSPGGGDNKPADDPKYDKERPIEISKLPTVTVDRDWLDYATLGVGFVVLIVGIFGVCYAKKTLDSIADQAKSLHDHAGHFEKLANATLRQTNHIVASNRAWIENKILEQPTPDIMLVDEKPETWGWHVGIVLRNTGKTACRVIDSHMRIEMVDSIDPNARPVVPRLPAVPIYRIPNDKPVQIAPKGTVWLPKKKFTYGAVIPKAFFMRDFLKWRTSEKVFCIYGFVEYKDAFRKKRTTRFCYAYIPIQSDFAMVSDRTGEALLPPGFELSGPPAYNEST